MTDERLAEIMKLEATNARLSLILECRRNPEKFVDEIASLKAQLTSASAETAACIKFLESELAWEDFRAEGFLGQETASASTNNCQTLRAFLKDKGDHGTRILAQFEHLPKLVAFARLIDKAFPPRPENIERKEWSDMRRALAALDPKAGTPEEGK